MNGLKDIVIFSCCFVISISFYGQSKYNYLKQPISLQSSKDKKAIAFSELGSWPTIEYPKISNNGEFVSYVLSKREQGGRVIVKDLKGSKDWIIEGTDNIDFLDNSNFGIYTKGDTLCLVNLYTKDISKTLSALNVKTVDIGRDSYLIYNVKNDMNSLYIRKCGSSKIDTISNCQQIIPLSNTGSAICIKEVDGVESLLKYDIITKKTKVIYASSGKIKFVVFDKSCKHIALIVEDKSSFAVNYFDLNKSYNQSSKYELSKSDYVGVVNLEFSSNSKYLFFDVVLKDTFGQSKPSLVNVNIWSYKDLVTQPNQQISVNEQRKYKMCISLADFKPIKVTDNDEILLTPPNSITGDFAVIKDAKSIGTEFWWRWSTQPNSFLISLNSGDRIKLSRNQNSSSSFSFSPDGSMLAFWDTTAGGNWISYDLKGNKFNNLTSKLKNVFRVTDIKIAITTYPVKDVVAWIGNNVIVYDNFDIWLLSGNAVRSPINLTNGYGKKNNLTLRFLSEPNLNGRSNPVLIAFSKENKSNGFFKLMASEGKDPEKILMEESFFYNEQSRYASYSNYPNSNVFVPTKSKYQDIWLLVKQSYNQMPNLYVTKNFRDFTKVTNYNVPDTVNWIKGKLINYKALDDHFCQAILYYPADFDSTKNYPVIFHFYERATHRLYQFPYPDLTYGDLNVPWFVSNGYMVCTPDIHHAIATECNMTVGERALNCIAGALNYLKKFSFIDSLKIGIQGHSFGGLETNYIITHTKDKFAAAAEFAGATDDVSHYLTLIPAFNKIEHWSKQPAKELGHEMFGANLWERQDLYLRNSPILSANKITCPVLITHNPSDNNVQFRQGVELYMALRRLGKKCWFIEYPEDDHMLNYQEAMDYTIRLTQFFDHYLKGTPPPIWMTKGINARDKGKNLGYQLDILNIP